MDDEIVAAVSSYQHQHHAQQRRGGGPEVEDISGYDTDAMEDDVVAIRSQRLLPGMMQLSYSRERGEFARCGASLNVVCYTRTEKRTSLAAYYRDEMRSLNVQSGS